MKKRSRRGTTFYRALGQSIAARGGLIIDSPFWENRNQMHIGQYIAFTDGYTEAGGETPTNQMWISYRIRNIHQYQLRALDPSKFAKEELYEELPDLAQKRSQRFVPGPGGGKVVLNVAPGLGKSDYYSKRDPVQLEKSLIHSAGVALSVDTGDLGSFEREMYLERLNSKEQQQ